MLVVDVIEEREKEGKGGKRHSCWASNLGLPVQPRRGAVTIAGSASENKIMFTDPNSRLLEQYYT